MSRESHARGAEGDPGERRGRDQQWVGRELLRVNEVDVERCCAAQSI